LLITDNNYKQVTIIEKNHNKTKCEALVFQYVMSFQAVAWGRSWTFEHKGAAES